MEVPVRTLDCKGLLCPLSIVKLSRGLKEIAVGEVLELVGTDPGLVPDMEAFRKQTGHEVSVGEHEPPVYRFLVRRTHS